jgi:two-component system phosphate regulon sensor histidine kinase PhoR
MDHMSSAAFEPGDSSENADGPVDPKTKTSDVVRYSIPVGRYRPHRLALGLGLILAVVCLAVGWNASAAAICIAAATTTLAVGLVLIAWETQRWDKAAQRYADARLEIDKWQQKWRSLYSDARQTATAFSHMLDGLIMVSPTGEILLINESARRLVGLSSKSDLLGRRFAEVVRIPEINRAVDAVKRGDESQVVNVEAVDGATVRPLRVQVNRISQTDESRVLLIICDETEAKHVEEIRREFIANISHELKTPLAAIKGYAETVDLAIKDDPEAAAYFMSQIHGQCLRLERLIADMMRLARAQSGSQFMTFTCLRLEDVIAESLKSYQPIAEGKSINLTVEGSKEGACVRADREALLTIINNLIGNAIRHTPPGGNVWVRCCSEPGSSEPGTSEPGRWALVVEDDGAGIPAKEQERIFERFYRVDKARGSAESGTGIGLSIVKNLTLAQHGQVTVTSQPNQGATFKVLLPSAVPDQTQAADADQVSLPS